MNTKIKESLIKYLAGLFDADGSLSFQFPTKNGTDMSYVCLHLCVSSSSTIDRQGFLEKLPDLTGMGSISSQGKPPNHRMRRWTVTKKSDLEMLLPRLIKHMVIKGKHWQWMLDTRRHYKGVAISPDEVESLKAASKQSRINNVGPVRPKNHPTWAWLAGYLDGDGHYSYKNTNSKGYPHIYVGAVAHDNDASVLHFIKNAFGGEVYDHSKAKQCKRWRRNLGPRDRSFVERFLPKLWRHARFKKHAIEQILHIHSQRLTVQKAAA